MTDESNDLIGFHFNIHIVEDFDILLGWVCKLDVLSLDAASLRLIDRPFFTIICNFAWSHNENCDFITWPEHISYMLNILSDRTDIIHNQTDVEQYSSNLAYIQFEVVESVTDDVND